MSFVHRETVRFRDCDPMGHLNSVARLARSAFRSLVCAQAPSPTGACRAAAAHVGGCRPIAPDPSRAGTKSFELLYELRAGDRVVANAKTILVGYDYEKNESTDVPERWKRRLSE